jgi:hypothetical protein
VVKHIELHSNNHQDNIEDTDIADTDIVNTDIADTDIVNTDIEGTDIVILVVLDIVLRHIAEPKVHIAVVQELHIAEPAVHIAEPELHTSVVLEVHIAVHNNLGNDTPDTVNIADEIEDIHTEFLE